MKKLVEKLNEKIEENIRRIGKEGRRSLLRKVLMDESEMNNVHNAFTVRIPSISSRSLVRRMIRQYQGSLWARKPNKRNDIIIRIKKFQETKTKENSIENTIKREAVINENRIKPVKPLKPSKSLKPSKPVKISKPVKSQLFARSPASSSVRSPGTSSARSPARSPARSFARSPARSPARSIATKSSFSSSIKKNSPSQEKQSKVERTEKEPQVPEGKRILGGPKIPRKPVEAPSPSNSQNIAPNLIEPPSLPPLNVAKPVPSKNILSSAKIPTVSSSKKPTVSFAAKSNNDNNNNNGSKNNNNNGNNLMIENNPQPPVEEFESFESLWFSIEQSVKDIPDICPVRTVKMYNLVEEMVEEIFESEQILKPSYSPERFGEVSDDLLEYGKKLREEREGINGINYYDSDSNDDDKEWDFKRVKKYRQRKPVTCTPDEHRR